MSENLTLKKLVISESPVIGNVAKCSSTNGKIEWSSSGSVSLQNCDNVDNGSPSDGNVLTWNNSIQVWGGCNLCDNIVGYDTLEDAIANVPVGKPYYLNSDQILRIMIEYPELVYFPVAYFAMDEGTGTEIADTYASPDDNTLTITSPANVQWSATSGPSSFLAKGVEITAKTTKPIYRATNLGLPLTFNDTSPLSISIWFKTTMDLSSNTLNTTVLFQYGSGGTTDDQKATGKTISLQHPDRVNIGGYGSTPRTHYVSGLTITDGNWHHIVGITKTTATNVGNISLYYDGVYRGTSVGKTVQPYTTETIESSIGSALFYYGGFGTSYSPFIGSIADVAVFNIELTAGQVEYLYNGELGRRAVGVPL